MERIINYLTLTENCTIILVASACAVAIAVAVWVVVKDKKSRHNNRNADKNAEQLNTDTIAPLLIKCPACGSEVSRYAPSCYQCGHPIYSSKTVSADRQAVVVPQESPLSNSVGLTGFILALISLVFYWVPAFGWIMWLLGFVFSLIGMFRKPRVFAVVGFLLSITDFIISLTIIGSIASMLLAILGIVSDIV